MKKKIKIYLIIVGIIGFLLLVLHTSSLFDITVDTTSVLLLTILIILPFVPNLKKVRWGEFEAEILSETGEKLSGITTISELIKSYLRQTNEHSLAPEIPNSEEKLTVSILQKQINLLMAQLVELQKQLSEIEATTSSEKEVVENYRIQINALLTQLVELQRQLNELQNI